MQTIYGYKATKFFQLTVQELKSVTDTRNAIENKVFSLDDDDFQLWENCAKDQIRLKKDLLKIGIEGYNIPIHTTDQRVMLMKYCNNRLSYGIGIENDKLVHYLCASPTLEMVILNIISEPRNNRGTAKRFLSTTKKSVI